MQVKTITCLEASLQGSNKRFFFFWGGGGAALPSCKHNARMGFKKTDLLRRLPIRKENAHMIEIQRHSHALKQACTA